MMQKRFCATFLTIILLLQIFIPVFPKAEAASNETIIYNFLKSEVGLNTAAACGVLANIEKESGFRNDVIEYGYSWDTGGGYGICQWTNSPRTSSTGRRTNLVNWCQNNGYDYTSLTGQLYYLKHELNTSYYYTWVTKKLLSVENSPQGAYDAGYVWCYYFEVPAGYNTGVSETRGNFAKNTYWPKYNDSLELEIDANYPTPFKCRTISTSNVPCYYSVNGSSAGEIYPEDDCIIQEVYTNDWVKCLCPWNDGTNKTVYVKKSVFINSSSTAERMTASKYALTYLRTGDSSSWGWIDSGDIIYKVSTSGNMTQIIYPADSGWRCGWVKTSDLNSHVHDYTGDRLYQPEHPHAISQRCVDYDNCGGFIWTGENHQVRECSQCWDIRFDFSKSSIKIENGKSATVSLSKSGSCYPEGAVFYFDYDENIINVTTGALSCTIEALKAGTCQLKLTVYSDRSKKTIICSDSMSVTVVDNTFTLFYNANGGSGAPTSVSGSTSYTISSTVPTRQGYTFLGWSTSNSASSATYKSGQTINLSSNITLYAVWKSASTIYTSASYSTNIEFADQEYYYTFTPSSSGEYTFESTGNLDTRVYIYNSSWTELGYNDDGGTNNNFKLKISLTSGTKYYIKVRAYSSKVGSTSFKVTKEVPLTYTLTYNANGGSGAPSIVSGATSYTISSTVPTKQGYTFLGWSTSSSASSATYKPGQAINLSSDTTLYAVWKSASAIYTSTSYNTNIEFSNQQYYYTFTPSSSGEYTFESIGSLDTRVYVYNSSWTELGYNDDSGIDSNFKLKINLISGMKYYVEVRAYSSSVGSTSFKVTKEASSTYTLTYNANGGSGVPSNQSGATSYTISSIVPTRQGYTFLGWSANANGTPPLYNPGESINLSADLTFYAVWQKNHEHSYTSVTTNPDCVNSGNIKHTCVCGESYSETIPATGHIFDNDDENCQICGYDRTDNCSCNCHRNGIIKLFFKVLLLFQRIFGINKNCGCGIAHY